MLKKVKAG